MTRHLIPGIRSLVLAGGMLAGFTVMANAEQVSRESDIGHLPLGQRVFVDDGSCPVGRIKLVTGAKLSTAGVVRTVACVARSGARR